MKYVGLIFRLHVSKYMNNPFPTIFDLNNDLLQVLLVILVVLSSEKNIFIFLLLKLKKVAAELEKSVVKIHLEEYTTKENVKITMSSKRCINIHVECLDCDNNNPNGTTCLDTVIVFLVELYQH